MEQLKALHEGQWLILFVWWSPLSMLKWSKSVCNETNWGGISWTCIITSSPNRFVLNMYPMYYVVVTPLRKAASYEPLIAILGIWGDTWLTRGKYGIYAAVRGSYGALTGSMWHLPCKISPIYCRVSYVAVARIPSLVLRNTWHYVIIRRRKFWFPKFVLRCSYEAALRNGVTTALHTEY